MATVEETCETLDEYLLKLGVQSGAKGCTSCRSRQMLDNEYSIAKIGDDTAEKEPLKVFQELDQR